MCQVHCPQAEVCIPHKHQHSGYDSHLWQDSKCHQKGTLGTYKGVPRSWKVLLGLSRGPEEKHGLIGENWGCDEAEMGFRRSSWKGGEWEWCRGVQGWPQRKSVLYTSPPVQKQCSCGETTSEPYKPTFHGSHLSRNMSYGSAAILRVFCLPWWRYSYSTQSSIMELLLSVSQHWNFCLG